MGRASRQKRARRQAWLKTGRVATRACPVCHSRLDAATEIALDEPREFPADLPDGSITACFYCGAILRVEAGQFRLVTDVEFAELDPDAQRILASLPTRADR